MTRAKEKQPVSLQLHPFGRSAGLVVLSRWTRFGSYLVTLWLLGIAVNLLTTGMFYDLAVRDVEIANGAFVLSQLTAVREDAGLAKKHTQSDLLVIHADSKGLEGGGPALRRLDHLE